jgi:hypothetical protein
MAAYENGVGENSLQGGGAGGGRAAGGDCCARRLAGHKLSSLPSEPLRKLLTGR